MLTSGPVEYQDQPAPQPEAQTQPAVTQEVYVPPQSQEAPPIATVQNVYGLFNVFVGVMVALSFIAMMGGLVVWWVQLGLIGRTQGIKIMEWGVVILFVAVVLLKVVQYFQLNPSAGALFAAIVVGIFIAIIAVQVARATESKEEE
jgi:hypothetical protein